MSRRLQGKDGRRRATLRLRRLATPLGRKEGVGMRAFFLSKIAMIAGPGLVLTTFAVSALAYTGGPVRAHVAGVDPTTERVFYYLTFHDESGAGPEVWFFDLRGESPDQPKRDLSLESRYPDGFWTEERGISEAWARLAARLTPLAGVRQLELRITIPAESIGVDSIWGVPMYEGDLRLAAQGIGQTQPLTMFCQPTIAIRALYQVPGRREAVAVVSYRGQAYGCDEVEQPILLTASPVSADCAGLEREKVNGELPSLEPFSFDRAALRGHTAYEFVARIGEVGAPEHPEFWFLTTEYAVSGEAAGVWLVSFGGKHPAQPIRYEVSRADSSDRGWAAFRSLWDREGRRGELYGVPYIDLRLKVQAESVGVDTVCGVPIYQGEVAVKGQSGSGARPLTMFCSTVIRLRGLYQLPGGAQLVVLTYTGSPCGCKEEDVPIVLYPR